MKTFTQLVANVRAGWKRATLARRGEREVMPGVRVPIKTAPTVRVKQHEQLANDFTVRVLDLPWAVITDETELRHFHSDPGNERYINRVREIYCVDISDIESGNLADIFDRIRDQRAERTK
jgi:hypothetical protein